MKKYLSEVLLITDSDNIYNIIDWLYWHLNIIGFEHAVIIDNSQNSILKKLEIKKLFKDKVNFYFQPGKLSQVDTYTKYVNNSDAWWVLPIDDDEYLYLDTDYYKNINDLILKTPGYLKISFNWLMLFSKTLIEKNDKKISYLNKFKYYLKNTNILNNSDYSLYGSFYDIKAMVNTSIKHLYSVNKDRDIFVTKNDVNFTDNRVQFDYEHMGNVHNPISYYDSKYYFAYNIAHNTETIGYRSDKPASILDTACLLHFKFRTFEEWNYKCNKRHKFSDTRDIFFTQQYLNDNIRKLYNKISTSLDIYNKAEILYNKYKNQILEYKNDN